MNRDAILAEQRLIPDQPPPTEGTGDVLLDLHSRVVDTNKLTAGHERPPRPLPELLSIAMSLARDLCAHMGVELHAAVLERRRIGIERYGQPLRYGDGRGLEDAAQEAIDLAAYIKREIGP